MSTSTVVSLRHNLLAPSLGCLPGLHALNKSKEAFLCRKEMAFVLTPGRHLQLVCRLH